MKIWNLERRNKNLEEKKIDENIKETKIKDNTEWRKEE